jgi:hypothetical protein
MTLAPLVFVVEPVKGSDGITEGSLCRVTATDCGDAIRGVAC